MGNQERQKDMVVHDNAQFPRLTFDGTFTPEVRDALHRKRIELGLPFQNVAKFFGINWSTFRKWEQGPTLQCEISYRPVIEKFINGELDEEINDLFTYKPYVTLSGSRQALPENINLCLERIGSAYALCRNRPELREEILHLVDKVTFKALEDLLNHHAGEELLPKSSR